MDKVLIKVVKLAGETGLLKPGSLVTLPEDTAEVWVSKGWAEYVIIKKELKQKPETKELKLKVKTKTKTKVK
jgi:hypothetical protein